MMRLTLVLSLMFFTLSATTADAAKKTVKAAKKASKPAKAGKTAKATKAKKGKKGKAPPAAAEPTEAEAEAEAPETTEAATTAAPLQPVQPPAEATPPPAIAAPPVKESEPAVPGPEPVPESTAPSAAAESPSTSDDSEDEDDKVGIVLGFSGGIAAGLSKPLGLAPLGALEIGYRFPFLGQTLGLSIEPTFMLFLASTDAGVRTDGMAVSIPLLASLNLKVGPGLLRALAGPTIAWVQVKTVDTLGSSTDTTWVFGAQAAVGYWLELPVGALFLMADFRVLPYAALSVNKMYLGVGGRLGYGFLF